MRVLITALPGYGHLCPLIPLAQALQGAGHEVAFATSQAVVGTLLPIDVAVLSAGPHWCEADFAHDTAPQSHAEIALPLHKYLSETVVPQMLSDIAQHIDRWRPDIILSNEYERVGSVLAEQRQIPFALVSSGPRLPKMLRQQWHAPLYAQTRQLCGLAPDHSLDYCLKWLHLCFTPPSFYFNGGAPYRPAANEFALAPAIFDSLVSLDPRAAEFVVADDVHPLILCTLGTVFNKDAARLKIIVDAFVDAPYRLLATCGPGISREVLGDLPDNIRLFDYLPLSALAANLAACITHGGTATLMTLLRAGVPCMLLPQGADHMVNVLTCLQQGLAVAELNTVSDAPDPATGKVLLTSAMIRQAVDRLLQTDDYRARGAQLRREFAQLPSMQVAVELLEQLAHTRAPIIKFTED